MRRRESERLGLLFSCIGIVLCMVLATGWPLVWLAEVLR